MPRTQFTFYESWYKAVSQLKKKSDQADIMTAICQYALYGEEPEMSGPPAAIFETIRPVLNTARRKSENGKKGGSKTKANGSKEEEKESKAETRNSTSTSTSNSNRTICYNPKTSSSKKFIPPSAEEVAEYVRGKGYHIDPEAFVAFYASKGWKVGAQPMKDWKAAVTTWERKDQTGTFTAKSEAKDRLEDWERRFYGEGS